MMGLSILLRIISLGAAMALVGRCAFLLLVVRPAGQKAAQGQVLLPFTHPLCRLRVWLGGPPPLAMLLTWAQRADHASAARIAAEATRRFATAKLRYGKPRLVQAVAAQQRQQTRETPRYDFVVENVAQTSRENGPCSSTLSINICA
jgi:hypothetical protein